MNALPFYLSFHDQIICLLYLLNGKFVRLNRLLYLYDVGVWEAGNSAQKRDVDFYEGAGLDPAINKLHWFLCGFEGAVLVRNARYISRLSTRPAPTHRRPLVLSDVHALQRPSAAHFQFPISRAQPTNCARNCGFRAGQLSFHDMLDGNLRSDRPVLQGQSAALSRFLECRAQQADAGTAPYRYRGAKTCGLKAHSPHGFRGCFACQSMT